MWRWGPACVRDRRRTTTISRALQRLACVTLQNVTYHGSPACTTELNQRLRDTSRRSLIRSSSTSRYYTLSVLMEVDGFQYLPRSNGRHIVIDRGRPAAEKLKVSRAPGQA